jgi:tRNA isopentenyl-2-thiomethyl-A-37 hydroxylase MiaE
MITRICKRIVTVVKEEIAFFRLRVWMKSRAVRFVR